jgi:GNAT superfamily N-acetyltransferase
MAEAVLRLGEQNPELAAAVFSKYNSIIDTVYQAETFLKELVKAGGDNPGLVQQVQQNLLRKARDFVASFAEQAGGKDLIEGANRLEKINAEVLLYLSVFKTLRRNGIEVNPEDLGAEFRIEEALQPDDYKQMREIYSRNYEDMPHLQTELLEKYDRECGPENGYGYGNDAENTFYILRVGGRIRAFNRFKVLGEDENGITHSEFGMFNVDPDYQGYDLGEAMMEKSLDLEARSKVIEASCIPTRKITLRYISKGFVATGFVLGHKGVDILDITRSDHDSREKYKSKFISRKDILSMHKNGASEGLMIISAADPADLEFELTNVGFVLTQYFQEKNGMYYAVYEESPETVGAVVG